MWAREVIGRGMMDTGICCRRGSEVQVYTGICVWEGGRGGVQVYVCGEERWEEEGGVVQVYVCLLYTSDAADDAEV